MEEKDVVVYGEEPSAESDSTTTEFPLVTEEKTTAKKPSLFRGKKKKKTEKPIIAEAGEAVRVYSAAEENTQPLDDTQELSAASSVMEKTQVIEMNGDEEKEAEAGGQILLDGFNGDVVSDEQLGAEERLRRVRREKIQDFSQKREQHMLEDAASTETAREDLVVYPDVAEEDVVEEEPVPETPAQVKERLEVNTRSAGLSLFFTAVFEMVLFILTIFSSFSASLSMSPTVYTVLHLVLFTLLIAFNAKPLFKGLCRLFSDTPTVASGVSLSVLVALLHTALQFLNPEGVINGKSPFITAISGLALLLFAMGRYLEVQRQNQNARLALNDNAQKTVYKCITDPVLAEEIGRPALAIGLPHVAYYRRSDGVSSYLETSCDDEAASKQIKWYIPTVVSLALVVSLVFFFTTSLSSWFVALSAFCAMVAAAAPALLFFGLQSALNRASASANKEGSGILGYQAVENYGTAHALALDSMDLFPEYSVLLHGIKTFSGTRIDDAILDAASVSVRAGGPLSHVFRRMIQNKVDMLRDVDTLVYEQDMGLSGWVNGRRILIGNRKLLDNHGIDIPSQDYEQRYAINGRQLVYLSIAGELSAMFVVSYIADTGVKAVLEKLTKQRVTLLIRTCDQNITEELVARVFGLNGFYVEVLNAPAGRSFEALAEGVSETETTGIVSNGDRNGLILALAMCNRLRNGTYLFTVLQMIASVAAMAMVGYAAFAFKALIPPVYMLLCLLFGCAATAIGSLFSGRK